MPLDDESREAAWHQDTALPLRGKTERAGWGPWSTKAGILYAHAPASALERIMALRVLLDDSESDNGPLRALPGTHRLGVLSAAEVMELSASRQTTECVAPARWGNCHASVAGPRLYEVALGETAESTAHRIRGRGRDRCRLYARRRLTGDRSTAEPHHSRPALQDCGTEALQNSTAGLQDCGTAGLQPCVTPSALYRPTARGRRRSSGWRRSRSFPPGRSRGPHGPSRTPLTRAPAPCARSLWSAPPPAVAIRPARRSSRWRCASGTRLRRAERSGLHVRRRRTHWRDGTGMTLVSGPEPQALLIRILLLACGCCGEALSPRAGSASMRVRNVRLTLTSKRESVTVNSPVDAMNCEDCPPRKRSPRSTASDRRR
jgi:hypothetical protein